jgi:hypothetical protein
MQSPITFLAKTVLPAPIKVIFTVIPLLRFFYRIAEGSLPIHGVMCQDTAVLQNNADIKGNQSTLMIK